MEVKDARKKRKFQVKSCLFFIFSCIGAIAISYVLIDFFPGLYYKKYVPPQKTDITPEYYEYTYYDLDISEQLEVSVTELDLSELPNFPIAAIQGKKYSEKETIKISNALIRIISGKPEENWLVTDLEYQLSDCNTGFDGFFHMIYHYELPVKRGEAYIVKAYTLDIFPQPDFVVSTTDHYTSKEYPEYTHLFNEQEVLVYATRAYELAEEYGGYEARNQKNSSNCEVNIALDNINGLKWHILYLDNEKSFFEAVVNPKTGELKVISISE